MLVNVCLHQVDDIHVSHTSLGFSATVKAAAVTAEISALSDSFSTPDWRKMSEACEGGVCVAYFKHCSRDEHAASCEYHFSQPGEMQNTTVRLIAKDRESIREAEPKFAVAVRTGWKMAAIPISRFTVESDAKAPPYCDRKAPQSACWR
jgi:hypothetical protein